MLHLAAQRRRSHSRAHLAAQRRSLSRAHLAACRHHRVHLAVQLTARYSHCRRRVLLQLQLHHQRRALPQRRPSPGRGVALQTHDPGPCVRCQGVLQCEAAQTMSGFTGCRPRTPGADLTRGESCGSRHVTSVPPMPPTLPRGWISVASTSACRTTSPTLRGSCLELSQP